MPFFFVLIFSADARFFEKRPCSEWEISQNSMHINWNQVPTMLYSSTQPHIGSYFHSWEVINSFVTQTNVNYREKMNDKLPRIAVTLALAHTRITRMKKKLNHFKIFDCWKWQRVPATSVIPSVRVLGNERKKRTLNRIQHLCESTNCNAFIYGCT